MHYRAILAYDGTAYQGFQRQSAGKPSVQMAVESALATVIGQPIRVISAARTDSGVHAAGQVISFSADWSHGSATLLRAINATLPDDIAMQRLNEAPAAFHPRFDAVSRTYRYQVYDAPVRNPLLARTAWQVHGGQQGRLDLAPMNDAVALLVGEHDFATFGSPTQGEATIRTLFRSAWRQVAPVDQPDSPESSEARLLWYDVEASGFLQHMVRALVGALVEIGLGKLSVTAFDEALRAADRREGRWMAPPQGLTLLHVRYPAAISDALDRPDVRHFPYEPGANGPAMPRSALAEHDLNPFADRFADFVETERL